MKSKHQLRIEEFMRQAEQELPEKPTIPNEEIRELRAKLILEESLETIMALGFRPTVPAWFIGAARPSDIRLTPEMVKNGKIQFSSTEVNPDTNEVEPIEPDLVEVADGCADISVVTYGTLSACGIPDEALIEMIDESNLAKFEPGSYRSDGSDGNPVGKWIKPPGWTAPNIAELLESFEEKVEPHGS